MGDWPWSSYRAHAGLVATPNGLDACGLHGYLLGRPTVSAADRTLAARHHVELVSATRAEDEPFWSGALSGQVFMDDEAFVQRMRMQVQAEPRRLAAKAIPKAQRAVAGTWANT